MKGRLAKWTADPLAGFFDDLLKDNLPSGGQGLPRGHEAPMRDHGEGQQLRNKADYYDEQEKMGAL